MGDEGTGSTAAWGVVARAVTSACLLVVGLALLPVATRAHHDGPHPTPLEVAEAMMPCLDRTVGPVLIPAGDDDVAFHLLDGAPIAQLRRVSPDDAVTFLEDPYPELWLGHDPVRPSLLVRVYVVSPEGRDVSDAWAGVVIPCLFEAYPL